VLCSAFCLFLASLQSWRKCSYTQTPTHSVKCPTLCLLNSCTQLPAWHHFKGQHDKNWATSFCHSPPIEIQGNFILPTPIHADKKFWNPPWFLSSSQIHTYYVRPPQLHLQSLSSTRTFLHKQPETGYDLELFAAVLAPGQTSLPATKYKETVWDYTVNGSLGDPSLLAHREHCLGERKRYRRLIWSVAVVQSLSCNRMDWSLPDSSVHGISQVRILEQVVISFSRGSSQPTDGIRISYFRRQVLYHWATREAPSDQ